MVLGPLRVLIVEDSALDAELVVAELRHGGYDVAHTRVETARGMIDALNGATWDVIVSDHELPGFSGPAALALLQESGLDVPFIVISGRIGEELAVSSLKAGADDFLIKGQLARLVPVIERERREVAERREPARRGSAPPMPLYRRYGVRHLPRHRRTVRDANPALVLLGAAPR